MGVLEGVLFRGLGSRCRDLLGTESSGGTVTVLAAFRSHPRTDRAVVPVPDPPLAPASGRRTRTMWHQSTQWSRYTKNGHCTRCVGSTELDVHTLGLSLEFACTLGLGVYAFYLVGTVYTW